MATYKDSLKKGSVIPLVAQDVTVTLCEECDKKMVNVDKRDITESDLVTLKRLGIKVSNPFTKEPVCIDCEEDDDDDNYSIGSIFRDTVRSIPSTPIRRSSPSSGGGFHLGGFGGFGGFGGGGFSGGGASRGW